MASEPVKVDSHFYRVGVEWSGDRIGQMKAEGLPAITVSAPPEFSGQAGVWTPEHLLVASTASCLMMTFLAIAHALKLPVLSFRMAASGKLENVPGEGFRFTEIALAPEVGVNAWDVEKAEKALAKAELKCFISNSLRSKIRVEPNIIPSLLEMTG